MSDYKTPFERAVDEVEGPTYPDDFNLFAPSTAMAALRALICLIALVALLLAACIT
jgi:hypothetical protein